MIIDKFGVTHIMSSWLQENLLNLLTPDELTEVYSIFDKFDVDKGLFDSLERQCGRTRQLLYQYEYHYKNILTHSFYTT